MQSNLFICSVVIVAVVGDQWKTSNDSDDSFIEVQQLRAELAKSNDKIATMDEELTQIKAILSAGKRLYLVRRIRVINSGGATLWQSSVSCTADCTT